MEPHTPATPEPTPIDILLVEDCDADILLTREAFAAAGVWNRLEVVHDGVAALERLRAEQGAYRPDVILLDLNLPRMNGLELLGELKRDPALMTIPVIMLTTSESEEDIMRSYQAHAACYLVKPIDFDRFYLAMQAMGRYMLSIVRIQAEPGRTS